MGTLSFLRAELLSLLFEALLFGCFSILYPISLWILVYRHRRDGRQYSRHGTWLFSIVTAMFLLAMTHLILSSVNYVTMFADHSGTANGAYLFYLSGRQDNTTTANMFLAAAITLIGDGFMTYRVFTMWGRSWKAIFLPSLLILGTIGSVGMTKYEATASGLDVGKNLYADKVHVLLTAYLALILATNIATVAFIIGRLVWHERMIRLYHVDEVSGPSIHWAVARTIIQSEALYSVTVGATLVSYVVNSEFFFVGSCMTPPLVGISFTLIITHVGFDDIKRQISEDSVAEHSRLDFQRAVGSSGEDSLRSITAPSTVILHNSGDPEKGEAVDGTVESDTSTSTNTRAGLAPVAICARCVACPVPYSSAYNM